MNQEISDVPVVKDRLACPAKRIAPNVFQPCFKSHKLGHVLTSRSRDVFSAKYSKSSKIWVNKLNKLINSLKKTIKIPSTTDMFHINGPKMSQVLHHGLHPRPPRLQLLALRLRGLAWTALKPLVFYRVFGHSSKKHMGISSKKHMGISQKYGWISSSIFGISPSIWGYPPRNIWG